MNKVYKMSKQVIAQKMNELFEEESQEAKDFLEKNFDAIRDELYRIDTTEDAFEDFFQDEIEKYDEYLALED